MGRGALFVSCSNKDLGLQMLLYPASIPRMNFTEQEDFWNLSRILVESGSATKVRMDGHLIWGRYGTPSFRA